MIRLLYLLVFALTLSCGKENSPAPSVSNPGNPSSSDWQLPIEEVRDGGVGKDGIVSIDNPKFETIGAADYMDDFDLIIAMHEGGQQHSYPHPILDLHEIVNDKVGNVPVAITYCPLTGTGTAWNRNLDGAVTTFGVSGLLYRNNLIPYDRKTDSNWSQIRLDCVQGPLALQKVETYPMVEMSWFTFKRLFPNENVLSTDTGSNRNYGRYPYNDYRTNNDFLLFPAGRVDDRLPAKERVLSVVVDNRAKVYRFTSFAGGLSAIQDNFLGQDLVVFGSKPDNILMAYQPLLSDGTELLLNVVASLEEGGIVMSDQFGNAWDVFGRAVSGPDQGKRLQPANTQIGYWFAFGAFFDRPEIYE